MTSHRPFFEIGNLCQVFVKITLGGGHTSLMKPAAMSFYLWQLVEKCWWPDPAKRPTMRDVVEYLDNAWGYRWQWFGEKATQYDTADPRTIDVCVPVSENIGPFLSQICFSNSSVTKTVGNRSTDETRHDESVSCNVWNLPPENEVVVTI